MSLALAGMNRIGRVGNKERKEIPQQDTPNEEVPEEIDDL
jgi:hypothetical protein